MGREKKRNQRLKLCKCVMLTPLLFASLPHIHTPLHPSLMHTHMHTHLVGRPPRNHLGQLRHKEEGDDHDDPMRPYFCFPHLARMVMVVCSRELTCGRGDWERRETTSA